MPISDYRKYARLTSIDNDGPVRGSRKRRGTRRHMIFSDWMLVMSVVGFELILIGLASSSFSFAFSGGALIAAGVVNYILAKAVGV